MQNLYYNIAKISLDERREVQKTIKFLQENGELKIIETPLDIELEIPHIAYIEVKKDDSKALLFTNPICRRTNQTFKIPIFMNLFGSFRRLELLGIDAKMISQSVSDFTRLSAPKNWRDLLSKIRLFSQLRFLRPKKLRDSWSKTHKIIPKDKVDLFSLPILKTWENDGGRFITAGQIYTHSLDNSMKNLGMYRLQIYDKNHLGMHFQIHKDSMIFFDEYKKAGRKMPVSVAIGGDPLYTWCAQAPLPLGAFELMLYGFIRKIRPRLRKCNTNDIFVPHDCDIIIEGFIDPQNMRDEGPFGDHTGYYTPIEKYPVMEVENILLKENAVYLGAVVGKPPLEDKYLGYATERIFLPLLQTTSPALIDYYMPENGVFHNLILAKIAPKYPAHAQQIMHGFWAMGQMSFVKHAIFVPQSAPELTNHSAITEFILNNFDINELFISQGIVDALDHSSPKFAQGGKLGIDCTNGAPTYESPQILSDDLLLAKIAQNYSEAVVLRQYFTHTKNPLILLGVEKKSRVLEHINAFDCAYCRIVFVVDSCDNDLENHYMCLWRITNNIDAKRDIIVQNNVALIDATRKGALENFTREWPKDVDCNVEVLARLVDLELIDKSLWRKFYIDKSYQTKG